MKGMWTTVSIGSALHFLDSCVRAIRAGMIVSMRGAK